MNNKIERFAELDSLTLKSQAVQGEIAALRQHLSPWLKYHRDRAWRCTQRLALGLRGVGRVPSAAEQRRALKSLRLIQRTEMALGDKSRGDAAWGRIKVDRLVELEG